MKTFDQMVTETAMLISEVMPWDLSEQIEANPNLLLIDVREADESGNWDVLLNRVRGELTAAVRL